MNSLTQSLQEKVHVSLYIAVLCFGFIIGVAAVPFANNALPVIPLCATTAVLLTIALSRRKVWMIILVCTAGFLLGMLRGNVAEVRNTEINKYIGATAVVSGVITDDPSLAPSGNQRVTLKQVDINGERLSGTVWVDTPSHVKLKRSDTVQVEGLLKEGFGTASATMFRAHLVSVERTQHGDIGLEIRDWFAAAVRAYIPPHEAALGLGYLLGQRSDLPESMNEKLQLLGLTHVVVASGFNLTILVRFTRRLLVHKSKYLATASATAMMVGFVLITGFSPSMTRAALVTGLGLLAWYYGRRIHPLVLLPFAAAITLVINPTYIWGDIGWYLSFVSFAGVLLLAPLIRTYFFGQSEPPTTLGIFIETMSAVIATFPLTAYIFGQYSLLALPANTLILPFVPIAMLCTFVAGLAELLMPFAAAIIAWPARFVLDYMTTAIDWLGAIPGAGGSITFGLPLLVSSYVIIVLGILWLVRKTGYRFKDDDPLL